MGEHKAEGEHGKAQVVLTPGSTANQLIGSIIQAVEINSFKEIIPSMNDIFISKVNEGATVGTQSNFTE